jgi:hypothetical protein
MASYLKFELEDGTFVYLEAAEAPKSSSGLIPASRGDNTAETTPPSFEKSIDSLRKMAAVMVSSLREGFTIEPDEVSISFGVKASAELGNLLIARGGMDANYNVSLRWHNEKKEKKE